jgi:hypothetical protein
LGFLAVFRIFCSARNREVSILYLRWLVSVLYTYSFHTCKDFLSYMQSLHHKELTDR